MNSGQTEEQTTSTASGGALDATIVADPLPPEPRPVPTMVGRYAVESTIGSGAMGIVLRAHDPKLDRIIAIKLLHGHGSVDAEGEARMVREARALARLSHPNVIDVYDVGRVDGQIFIAMEYVAGKTLDAWMAHDRPERAAVIEAFVQAGRGLAAAHDAGLVHRDFKPANVLRGRDGRVRVLDFGLAAPPKDARSEIDPTLGSLDGTPIADVRVTATGMVMGTPAYMSPEAHGGLLVDARSDQFSFCVALFEALWGKRPFLGPTPTDVATQAAEGQICIPSGVEVPVDLRQVVLRGLRPDPAERWPSMHDLLAQLRPQRRKRWPWMVVAGAAVASIALALVLSPSPHSCTAAGLETTQIWAGAARQRVHDAFLASGAHQAEQAFTRVDDRLTDHLEALITARRRTCEARFEGTQSPGSLDRATACLERHQAELSGVVAAFERADADTVRNAIEVVSDLRSVTACREQALATAVAPPRPQIVEHVEQAHQDLALARALVRAGHYEQAAASIEQIEQRVEALDYPPLLAEVQYLHGRTLEDDGEYEAARERMEAALMTAQEAGDEPLVADISTQLIYVVGNRLGRPEEAERWIRHARAAVDRLAEPREATMFLEHTLGSFYWMRTELPKSQAHFERAIEYYEQEHGSRHPQTMIARSNLAMVLHQMGHSAKARALTEQVLADRIEVYGEDHPEVVASYANLANIEQTVGELDAAVAHNRRALTSLEQSVGREHPHYPQLLINLANARYRQGHIDEALELYQQALELLIKTLGPRAALIGRTLSNMGAASIEQERFSDARTYLVRALDIYEERYDADDPQLATLVGNLAFVDQKTDRLEQSLAGFDRALTLLQTAYGEGHPSTGWVHHGRATTYHEMGRTDEALADLRLAVAVLAKGEFDPLREAKARFDLAELLGETDELDEAKQQMTQARATLARVKESKSDLAEKIDAWWAEHR